MVGAPAPPPSRPRASLETSSRACWAEGAMVRAKGNEGKLVQGRGLEGARPGEEGVLLAAALVGGFQSKPAIRMSD